VAGWHRFQNSIGKRSQFRISTALPPHYVHILLFYVQIWAILTSEKNPMASDRNRAHKHFQLDPVKIRRAQRMLRADTETEAIERALDLVIAEHESNRLGAEANDRFVKSGIEIKDVYGKMDQ
jgi:hypothetical protein